MTTDTISTTTVRCIVSGRLGHTTFLSSEMMSMTQRGRQERMPCFPFEDVGRGALGIAGPAPRLGVLVATGWRLIERFIPSHFPLALLLTHLAVDTMAPTTGAELPELQPVGVVAAVLSGSVVPRPTLRAGQMYYNSVFFLGHWLSAGLFF